MTEEDWDMLVKIQSKNRVSEIVKQKNASTEVAKPAQANVMSMADLTDFPSSRI